MFHRYNHTITTTPITIPAPINDTSVIYAQNLRGLQAQLEETERKIADNVVAAAILKNNNRILENHIQGILKNIDNVENLIRHERMAKDLADMHNYRPD